MWYGMPYIVIYMNISLIAVLVYENRYVLIIIIEIKGIAIKSQYLGHTSHRQSAHCSPAAVGCYIGHLFH